MWPFWPLVTTFPLEQIIEESEMVFRLRVKFDIFLTTNQYIKKIRIMSATY